MKIVVYHGGTDVVEHPLCKVGRANLDFGQGFYVNRHTRSGNNMGTSHG